MATGGAAAGAAALVGVGAFGVGVAGVGALFLALLKQQKRPFDLGGGSIDRSFSFSVCSARVFVLGATAASLALDAASRLSGGASGVAGSSRTSFSLSSFSSLIPRIAFLVNSPFSFISWTP